MKSFSFCLRAHLLFTVIILPLLTPLTGFSSPGVAGAVYGAASNILYVNDNSTTGDLYTSAVGNNANTGSASDPFATIQHSIDQASAGDTIYVDAGTYPEDVWINKEGIVIIGAGIVLTTIDHTGQAGHNNAGVSITRNNVEIYNLTVTGNKLAAVPRYGLKVGVSTSTTNNVVLENVRVQNSYRTGFDLARPKDITLRNTEAVNNGGAGIFMNNAEGAVLENITTSGNSWTGVSIATRSDWGGDTYGVYFTGSNSFGENNSDNGGVQIESDSTMLISWSNDSADGKDVTIRQSELGFALSGPTTNTFNTMGCAFYFRFFGTLAEAESAAGGHPDHVDAPRYIRDADNSDGLATTHFYVYDNGSMTIQAAVNAATEGNTVNVFAGEFTEQVEIDKDLTVSGQGQGVTTIKGMANMPLAFSTFFGTFRPVIYVHHTDSVTLKDFTLDGDGHASTNSLYIGVGYNDAGGLTDGLEITGTRYGIYGEASLDAPYGGPSLGSPRTLTIQNSRIFGFRSYGIHLNGQVLTGKVINNEIIGTSQLSLPRIRQYGIYFFDTQGEIRGNQVKRFRYNSPSDEAYALLIQNINGGGIVNITENMLDSNDVHIQLVDNNVIISANEIRNGKYGILGNGGFDPVPVSNNQFHNLKVGLITDNRFEVHNNSFTSMDTIAIIGSNLVDAECNWYGTTNAPAIDAMILGNVNYTPWLINGTDNDAATGFQPVPGSCTGPSVVGDSLLIVSDTSWRKSTVTTTATANQYPWNGVNGNLPGPATFSLPVEIGQPQTWHTIDSVEGTKVLKSGSGITYFRRTFDLATDTGVVARFRSYMDDGIEIYINGYLLAREADRNPANARGAYHDLRFLTNGTHQNGYMGGDAFDFVNNYRLDSLVLAGENELVVALRNKTNGDVGGFSFRMDLKSNEPVIPELTGYMVSDINWKKSTYTTNNTALTLPWAGSPWLPADNTFTLPVEIGQPHDYQSIFEVEGSYPIKAEENLTYYRGTFNIIDSADINARFRATFDDGAEIYLNRRLLVRADDINAENRKLPGHDILYKADSTVENGFGGGDMFEYVSNAGTTLDTLLHKGENSVIVVVRNRPNDKGGFSFRLDLDQNGTPVMVKKQSDANEDNANLPQAVTPDFNLYPNPTTGKIYIDLIGSSTTDNEVLLFDLNGKLLHKRSLKNPETGPTGMDLSTYPNGIYIIRMRSGDHYSGKRIIKF